MGRPYSLDLRERVVTAMTAGMSGQKEAPCFSIGESSALRWARRAREIGSPKVRRMERNAGVRARGPRRWITVRLAETSDLTLRVLAAGLKARGARGKFVRCLEYRRRHGLSFKNCLHGGAR